MACVLGLLCTDLTGFSVVIVRLVEFGAYAIVIRELPCIVSPTIKSELAFDGCRVLELTLERELRAAARQRPSRPAHRTRIRWLLR